MHLLYGIMLLAASPLAVASPTERAPGLNKRGVEKHWEYMPGVAGHAGTMTTDDGRYFIKPCTKAEADFHEEAMKTGLRTIIPEWRGTIELTKAMKQKLSEVEQMKTSSQSAGIKKPKWAIKMENLNYGFQRPNVLDIKLGNVLTKPKTDSELAAMTEEEVEAYTKKLHRQEQTAQTTTSWAYHFRLSGMQVWRGDPELRDYREFAIYDRKWSENIPSNLNEVQGWFKTFLFNQGGEIDDDDAESVAKRFVSQLKQVMDVMQANPTKTYSSSLLFVYEGHGPTLKWALEHKDRPISRVKWIDFSYAWPLSSPDTDTITGVNNVREVMKSLM